MSTSAPLPPGQPAPPATPNSNETRELLKFLGEQNEANRKTIRDDAESNRKVFLDIMKIVSIPLSLIILVAAFFGIKSISDIKDALQNEARRETQSEISRMQTEIRNRLDEQFKAQALQTMVKEAARESTKAAAEPLIKAEVQAQVRAGVDALRPTIVAAATQQAQTAVKQIGPQIDSLVKKTVDTKVSTEVDPVIATIKAEADVQLLITRLNAGDAQAFDTLNRLPLDMDPQRKNVVIAALRVAVAAHNSGMYFGRTFNTPQSENQLITHLSDPDSYGREAALDTLIQKKNLSLLPRIVEMMSADPSINVRCSAYRAFDNWTVQTFQCLDPAATLWWEANKKNFQ
ncbi:MAG: hypothetical protein WA517_06295 [Candidatus Acidiferrum sp.]